LKIACAYVKGIKKTSKRRPKSIPNSMTNLSKNNVVLKPFFVPHFFHFFVIVFKNGQFWDPLRNPMGSKMAPKSGKWCHKSQILTLCSVCFEFFGVPCSRPCFSRNHSNPRAVGTVILVPLGPSVLKNMICSMMIGYLYVFTAFRCAMFYMSFLSHLLKKTQ
jgi:hypothetical protein